MSLSLVDGGAKMMMSASDKNFHADCRTLCSLWRQPSRGTMIGLTWQII
jgi:hypothetical protein